jgi:hypothetical protein
MNCTHVINKRSANESLGVLLEHLGTSFGIVEKFGNFLDFLFGDLGFSLGVCQNPSWCHQLYAISQ